MATQRKIGLWLAAAASLMLAAVLVWWLAGGSKADASLETEDSTSASSLADKASRARPVAARLDLVTAPKAAVSGTIRDLEGRPIPDAQVCAISNAAERLGIDDRKAHCVRSGPDGRYRIESLLPINTEIHASAATFQPNRWERRERGTTRSSLKLHAGQTIEDVDIALAPGGVLIQGVVKDIAGGEIEGAEVRLRSGDFFFESRSRGSAITYSGAEGRFELWGAPGQIGVVAQAEGYAQGEVRAIAPGEFVELFLTPESVLVGEVVLADSGEPVEGAVVSIGFRGSGNQARTDARGRFRIDRLEPGTYKPSARTEELYGQTAEQVHLGFGQVSDPIVIRVHPAVFVEGTVVVAGTDRPCTDGWVRLDNEGVNSEWTRIDEEGHVEFRGVLPGEYQVSVSCTGHISEDEYDKLVVGTESLSVVWEVREGLTIRGEVVDESGRPLERVGVSAQPVVDSDAARAQVTGARQRSESDGSFELAGLLPGRYEVNAGGWREPGPLEPITVELESGADVNDVRIVMPALGSVRGRVIDEHGKPVAGATLVASLIDGQSNNASRSNDAGEFTIEQLRPGPTRVTAGLGQMWSSNTPLRKPGTSDDDLQGEVVEVVANEVVELTLTVEASSARITGVVKDEGGGPVADAFVDVERLSEKAGASTASARRGVRWSWGKKPVLTDADGHFAVGELTEGRYLVRAHRKGGGEAVLEDVAVGSHVELTITSTGELAGTVTLAGGGAPERFTIAVQDKVAGISQSDSFFRTGGAWRLRELPAGSFEITASAREGTVTLDAPLELGEGELREGVNLVLEPRITLRGRVVDLETREPVAGLEVFVVAQGSFSLRSDDADRRNVTGADGRFEVENATTGKISVIAWNRAAGSKAKYEALWQPLVLAAEPLVQDLGELEVVATRVEPKQKAGDLGFEINDWDPTVEPTEWEPIVASVRPGGPAEQGGLTAGDVIEKVDGHEVSGSKSGRYRALTHVPEGTVVKLGVRGGKTVEITAGPPIR
ncbi:MAG: carboxypeptidase regulatory-like domain-containing protein [Enhygromyxa sp.]